MTSLPAAGALPQASTPVLFFFLPSRSATNGKRNATALGFAFDPRYRDFPFASLTMAVVPFAALMLLNRPKDGVRPIAESAFAGLQVAAALFMGFNEGGQNWQSMWTCAIYLLLAFTLSRARAVQIPK